MFECVNDASFGQLRHSMLACLFYFILFHFLAECVAFGHQLYTLCDKHVYE